MDVSILWSFLATRQQVFSLAVYKFQKITVLSIMQVEIVEISSPIGQGLSKTLYVVRTRRRYCVHMDYYTENVSDFGAYESYDMAVAVKNAIEQGDIKI